MRAFIDRHIVAIVWTLRILLGATFIFSGFSKAVDPWGFMYKIQEYLMAWGMAWVPKALVLTAGAALSMAEFCIGVLLVLGSWRRVAATLALAVMCVMLPLSLYIAVASPVDDCGCFGEAWVIPNWATFAKNVVLFLAALALNRHNRRALGAFPPIAQWIVLICSMLYCAMLSIIGYLFQPMVDFRPYRIGTSITADIGAPEMRMTYVKDGQRQSFPVSDLPGDDWTYVAREEAKDDVKSRLAVFDDGEDVTADVFLDEGPQLLLVVSDPASHTRARANMANSLCEFVKDKGGDMIGLLPLQGSSLEEWRELAAPDFPLYSVDDTQLKELVRGEAALVYLEDGIIKWKRNIYYIPGNLLRRGDNALDTVFAPDAGPAMLKLTAIYLAAILLTFAASVPFLRRYYRQYGRKKHKQQNPTA